MATSTASANRFSDELLREIFLAAEAMEAKAQKDTKDERGDDEDDEDDAKLQSEEFRIFGCNIGWIIPNVCKRWREVADPTPLRQVVDTDIARITVSFQRGKFHIVFARYYGSKQYPLKDVLPIILRRSRS